MAADLPEGGERRRYIRQPARIPVDYSSVDAFFTEFASDINEGGVFVQTESPSEPGEMVALEFRLPGVDEPLEIVGRVAWVADGKAEGSSPGMGIEFHHLTSEVRDRINQVVRSLRR